MKRVIILRVLIILMVTVMTGCAVKEAYLFNQPIHPSGLSSDQKQKMQAREVERQKTEAEEYSNTGVPVLVLRL